MTGSDAGFFSKVTKVAIRRKMLDGLFLLLTLALIVGFCVGKQQYAFVSC